MRRIFQIGTLLLLLAVFLSPVLEIFDRWDGPGPGNDTEMYSKSLDDASYDTEQPQNPYAFADERAVSLQDQRMRVLTGLEFASILSFQSGFRSNPVTGVDSNREHVYPFAARPQGSAVTA